MQDGVSRIPILRGLATFSAALAGLMMTLIGAFIPAAMLVPIFPLQVLSLPSTWQVPSLLLCSLIAGPKSGVIAGVAYLSIGIFHLPVFHGGGSIPYIFTPSFGYLIGLIPASWVSGQIANQRKMNDFLGLTFSAISGLLALHLIGIINLLIGSALLSWNGSFPEMLFSYSIGVLPSQIALCCGISLIALPLRRLLLIE